VTWPAAIAAGWHPVALLSELREKPIARTLLGEPLVIFRGENGPAIFRDRCPHRGMPLSLGRVERGCLVCPYHGWSFAENGACRGVPGSNAFSTARAEQMPVYKAAGLIWSRIGDGAFPVLPPVMRDRTLDRFWWAPAASDARVLDALENHLDPAHPHHVHPWIVRAPDKRVPTRVAVRIDEHGASATYHEQAQATGLIPRLFEGHRTTSIGRLWPPTIGEVTFEGPHGLRLSIAVVFSPEDAARTRPYAHFATPKGRMPAGLKRGLLKAFHWPILAQDRRALAAQASRAGPYATGPLDFLAPAIWAFANGRTPEPQAYEAEMLL
jgi:phenylpropionate dioxygenase-like ring-hydroxylating dioxygenase large terminal subunit